MFGGAVGILVLGSSLLSSVQSLNLACSVGVIVLRKACILPNFVLAIGLCLARVLVFFLGALVGVCIRALFALLKTYSLNLVHLVVVIDLRRVCILPILVST